MPMTETHVDLKGLQVQQKRIREQIEEAKFQLRELNQTLNSLQSKDKELSRRIQELTSREVIISEHAILRFLERTMNLDMDAIKKAILPDHIRSQIEVIGDGSYPNPIGCKLRAKNRTIVTIVD